MTREDKTTKESLSSGIVSYLRERGMTLKRIGETIRCSESFVCRVGKGERSFTVEHLTQLEKNLGAPLPVLLLEARQKDSAGKRMRSSYQELRRLLKNSAKTRASLFGEEVDCPVTVSAVDHGTETRSATSMATVTKKELISRIAEHSQAKRAVVKQVVQAFLDEIVSELCENNRLVFRDFGVFEPRTRAARIAQNPKTLQRVEIPAKRTVKFKMGRRMKQNLFAPTTKSGQTKQLSQKTGL